MSEETELLREAVELLRLIAEPFVAKRDEKFRISLYELVGKSGTRASAVKLMDGMHTQSEIRNAAKMDPGNLSRFVKSLREKGLVTDGDRPKLLIPVPPNFPEKAE
jgi:hypothetical protein